MDIWASVLLPAVTAVAVAAVISRFITRRSEVRTAIRDGQIRRLSDTRTSFLANLDYLVRRRARGETSPPMDYPSVSDTPQEQLGLLGDQEVLDRVALWTFGIGFLVDDIPLTAKEYDVFVKVKNDALRALDEQMDRAIRFERLRPPADMQLAMDRANAYLRTHPDGRPRKGVLRT